MTAPEPARARRWRETMNLSRGQIAELTGYSLSQVQNFELGFNRSTQAPIAPRDMLTYKMACAAVASGLRFDWGPVTIRLD